jgi:hypothetical protein
MGRFMSSKQKKIIKALKLKREAFRREIESFQAILDAYDEETSIKVIQNLLSELEEEYAVFKETQSKLDGIDKGKTMQERIDLKMAFNICKGRAQSMIETTKMQTSDFLSSKEEKISSDQELTSSDELETTVHCHPPIIPSMESNALRPDQNTEDNSESTNTTENSQSVNNISNIPRMDFRENLSSTLNAVPPIATTEINNNIVASDFLPDDIIAVLQWLEGVFVRYCFYAHAYNQS